MTTKHTPLSPANISWANNTPMSPTYGDIYFHEDQGIAETQHVFINGNNLAQRFSEITEFGTFTLGETGFGTGLNFLSACQLWLKTTPATATLHYISAELHPLLLGDLEKSLAFFEGFEDISAELIKNYPKPVPGLHYLELFEGRICVSLLFDDAAYAFSQLECRVDAWFLDGFTPSKNPEMWSQSLFDQLARLSRKGTTASTFTVSGIVRKALTEAGFTFERSQGFGKKLEMLKATYPDDHPPRSPSEQPWFDLPLPDQNIRRVAIIGAGLAGASTAFALAQKGINITVFETEGEIAAGGSGNKQGALYAKIPTQDNPSGAIHTQGLDYTLRLLRRIDPKQSFWQESGVYQLATTEKEKLRQAAVLENSSLAKYWLAPVTPDEVSAHCGTSTPCHGHFMKEAGWVSPKEFCAALLNHPKVSVKLHCTVKDIKTDQKSAHIEYYAATTATTLHESYDAVVVCNAASAKEFAQTQFLPLKAIRGQVSSISSTHTLNSTVCGSGYISPPYKGALSFGATFDLHNSSTTPDNESHLKNIGYLADTLPELASSIGLDQLEGRVSFRCATQDYLPVVGKVPDFDAFIVDFAKLRDDKSWVFKDVTAPVYQRLFVNVGHGSKGLITAPIAAQLVCAQILGTPNPISKTLINRLNPARFIVRSLTRS